MTTATEAKQRLGELVDYYYEKLAECKTLKEVYELNWYCSQRLTDMSYGMFSETWGRGWDAVTEPKDVDS